MAERMINARVRPARAQILINRSAELHELALVFRFLSQLWGGRFFSILPVDVGDCDPLTAFRLERSRPEFVYGVGIDDHFWASAARSFSQPRAYYQLNTEFVNDLRKSHYDDHILADAAILRFYQKRATGQRVRPVHLVAPASDPTFAAISAALFGTHSPNLRRDLYDELSWLSENTSEEIIHIATRFVKEYWHSWIDVTGYSLNLRIKEGGWVSPTIVLVKAPIPDLSLFWNLRTATTSDHPAWVIPVASVDATSPAVLEALKQWLIAFSIYGPTSNHCVVTSDSVTAEECALFASLFETALAGTAFSVVEYDSPTKLIPTVVPYEYETAWPIQQRKQKILLQPPRPQGVDGNRQRSWMVDLLSDLTTGRQIKNLRFPSHPVISELLNGPCPPTSETSRIARTGDGIDGINIRCSSDDDVLNLYLPNAEEVFGEILREYQVEPYPDEKRSSYLPIIKRLGGLYLAAAALSGQSREILYELRGNHRTSTEIQGTLKLQAGKLATESYLENTQASFRHASQRIQRVAKTRFAAYVNRSIPEDGSLDALLEHWVNRSIVTRHWKIGPCIYCRQHYYVPHINIQRPILCENCGNRISLRNKARIGYALHGATKRAIDEGLAPVVLTGRFLLNLTADGFFWLPGLKYTIGEQRGDVDILACCDGYLAFCECKDLISTPESAACWEQVGSQFLQTAELAIRCKAHFVVLASLAAAYPANVSQRIADALTNRIPYLLLDRGDLEMGHRIVDRSNSERLHLRHVIPPFFREETRPSGRPRHMTF